MKLKNRRKETYSFLIAAIVILCLSAAVLAGCGGKSRKGSKYLGKWNAVTAELSGVELQVADLMGEFSIELKEDGVCEVHLDGESESGTWEESENGVTIRDSTDTLTVNEKDGNLYIEYEGVSFRFEKE